MTQSTDAIGRILVCLLALFACGNMERYFVLAFVSGSYLFYVWVLPCGVRKIGSYGR